MADVGSTEAVPAPPSEPSAPFPRPQRWTWYLHDLNADRATQLRLKMKQVFLNWLVTVWATVMHRSQGYLGIYLPSLHMFWLYAERLGAYFSSAFSRKCWRKTWFVEPPRNMRSPLTANHGKLDQDKLNAHGRLDSRNHSKARELLPLSKPSARTPRCIMVTAW